jgi:tRNA/tmRNA/rRNA uracil-C5-methylase (TrmA/RlmC/RlmD family)
MNKAQFTTRKQLQGYGATRYLATRVTKNLTPINTKTRAYVYLLNDVIKAIRDYLQRSRIKPKTARTLTIILKLLLERLGNVIEVPFDRPTNPEINQLAKKLTQAITNTDTVLAELKATAATIKAKYRQ